MRFDHVHAHPGPEELTELAARGRLPARPGDVDHLGGRRGGGADAELLAARACATCGPELAALEAFLASSRDALLRATQLEPADGAALAARALARTTREETSLRGDVRLMGAFVAARLRSSQLVRLAAASLLAHLLALPVLAWYVLERRAPDAVRITIAPPEDPVEWAEAEAERLPPLALPAPDEAGVPALVVADREPLRRENARRLARFELSRGGPSVPPATDDATRAEALLRARAELAAAFAAGRALPDLTGDDAVSADDRLAPTSLERALWAELLLDQYVLGGRSAELPAALDALCAGGQLGDAETASAGRRLEASALARAEAYGLGGATARERLRAELRVARERGDALELELLEGSDRYGRRVPLFEGPWLEALAAALPPELRDGAVARAWLGDSGAGAR